jgi:hypothetical protein
MQMRYPERLIEVDLPIARISAHARREKSIRHGHISTLHIWWARRPLAACRAVDPLGGGSIPLAAFRVGTFALNENADRTAQRLKGDYWLYTVFNCSGTPELHPIQDPVRLGWKPVVTAEHYRIAPSAIRQESSK